MNSSPINAPSTPQRSRPLTRDQRLQVLTLHRAHNNPTFIAKFLRITLAQVKYTVRSGHVSPKKSKGATPKLNSTQVDELEKFVCSSPEARQMSYLELASHFSKWNVAEEAIKNALKKRGYSRRYGDPSLRGRYVTMK